MKDFLRTVLLGAEPPHYMREVATVHEVVKHLEQSSDRYARALVRALRNLAKSKGVTAEERVETEVKAPTQPTTHETYTVQTRPEELKSPHEEVIERVRPGHERTPEILERCDLSPAAEVPSTDVDVGVGSGYITEDLGPKYLVEELSTTEEVSARPRIVEVREESRGEELGKEDETSKVGTEQLDTTAPTSAEASPQYAEATQHLTTSGVDAHPTLPHCLRSVKARDVRDVEDALSTYLL